MKRKEKNEMLKRMADALDKAMYIVINEDALPKELGAEIVGLLRECDEQMPHFISKDSPRKYTKLISEGKIDLTVEVER